MLRLSTVQRSVEIPPSKRLVGVSVERPLPRPAAPLTACSVPSMDKVLPLAVQVPRDFGDFSALDEAFLCRGTFKEAVLGGVVSPE